MMGRGGHKNNKAPTSIGSTPFCAYWWGRVELAGGVDIFLDFHKVEGR